MIKKKSIKYYSRKSSLMDIRIKYGGETFKFNLNEELAINENKINSEIKQQPISYAFLGQLHKKLIRIQDNLEAKAEATYSKLYLRYKETPLENGKLPSEEHVKRLCRADDEYNDALHEFFLAKENASTIGNACRSFDNRGHMIQTISANLRQESKQ